MRGNDQPQGQMFSYVGLEERVPKQHPLRRVLMLVNTALRAMDGQFAELYSDTGRPSIPPEQLLRALLLQALYSVRSERMLMEQLNYNLLFRWFVGLAIDDPVWDDSVFTKNRDRLLEGDIAAKFFRQILQQAERERLLSAEHFSVDGTLIEAWANKRTFIERDQPLPPPAGSRGKRGLNQTHRCTVDPDARLFKKSRSAEAKLCHMGHVISEHRNGLIVAAGLSEASTLAERTSALNLLSQLPRRRRRIKLAADKAYDETEFVGALRAHGITPHVAQYGGQRSSAIDGRTTRHAGYQISQKKRRRVEQIFGWMKSVGLMRKTRHRGRALVEWMFVLTASAYNVLRMAKLCPEPA